MNTPIRRPFLERRNNNAQAQKEGRPCGANVFPANSLVYLDNSGNLAAVASGGVAVYGWSHGPSVVAGTPPPQALYQLVYPFDLQGESMFVMSTTNAAGDAGNTGTGASDGDTPGVNDSAPALSTVVIGQSYGILRPTTGPNAGIQLVNLSDTTNKLVTVVALYPNQATTDRNGLVLVKIVPTTIQA